MKVDTGMHRVGADPDEARALVEEVVEAPELSYGGLWTHLAVADEPDDPFTDEQLARFEAVRKSLQAAGVPAAGAAARRQLGRGDRASAARAMTWCAAASPFTATSPLPPSPPSSSRRPAAGPLRPALGWKTQVSHVRELAAGERTSYGLAYELVGARRHRHRACRLCRRGARGRFSKAAASCSIGGRRRRVAGAVTMDQLLVDCGPDSGVRRGRRGRADRLPGEPRP